MKKLIALVIAVGLVGAVMAADYTPVSSEGGKVAVSLTPTSNTAIAVLGGYNAMTAAAASTNNTIANPVSIGVECKIVNIGANAVTITDGTNIEGAGAMVMGQYDSLTLVGISTTKWAELSRSDN